METEVIAVIITLFSLNYAGIFILYKKIGIYENAVKILCREHSKNHGDTEIRT